MIKRKLTLRQIVVLMLLFSVLMYIIHYLIFRDFHHIAIFFVHDIAFLPLEIILVSLGLDKLIDNANEEEARSKLSIIETLFFKESGRELLRYFTTFDPTSGQLKAMLQIDENWVPNDYLNAKVLVNTYEFQLDVDAVDFFGLHDHLNKRYMYFRDILENPSLTQSSEFTQLIMQIYLLWDELDCRTDLYALKPEEREELGHQLLDIYRELTLFWLDNAHNHCVYNPLRLRRVIANNPFKN